YINLTLKNPIPIPLLNQPKISKQPKPITFAQLPLLRAAASFPVFSSPVLPTGHPTEHLQELSPPPKKAEREPDQILFGIPEKKIIIQRTAGNQGKYQSVLQTETAVRRF
ncbi:MAG: hypothetical protein ACK56F_23210, partial [bacterium]